jgi:hypothetical protein
MKLKRHATNGMCTSSFLTI